MVSGGPHLVPTVAMQSGGVAEVIQAVSPSAALAWTTAITPTVIAEAYGLRGAMPVFVIVDPAGKIRSVFARLPPAG